MREILKQTPVERVDDGDERLDYQGSLTDRVVDNNDFPLQN